MNDQNAAAGPAADPSDREGRIPVVNLTDVSLESAAGRPRRIFDFEPLRTCFPAVREITWLRAKNDVELDEKLDRMGGPRQQRVLSYIGCLWSMFTHLGRLRRAAVIFCFTPHHFWWVALLWRCGLLPSARDKVVCGVFSKTSPLRQKQALLRKLPPGFHAYFMVRRQIDDLVAGGCPPERLKSFTWRIDANWYVPAPKRTPSEGGYILCAGMAYRDEELVIKLVGRTGRKLIRAARTPHLQTIYRERLGAMADDPAVFEYRIMRDHRDYLPLLQNADLLLLPLREVSDEPAGLTTALEALACGVPLLANGAYGVTEVLAGGYGLKPIPDNRPESWLAAIDAALRRESITEEVLRRGRRFVEEHHHVSDDIEDWREIEPVRRSLTEAGR